MHLAKPQAQRAGAEAGGEDPGDLRGGAAVVRDGEAQEGADGLLRQAALRPHRAPLPRQLQRQDLLRAPHDQQEAAALPRRDLGHQVVGEQLLLLSELPLSELPPPLSNELLICMCCVRRGIAQATRLKETVVPLEGEVRAVSDR